MTRPLALHRFAAFNLGLAALAIPLGAEAKHESPSRQGQHWANAAAGIKTNARLARNIAARFPSALPAAR